MAENCSCYIGSSELTDALNGGWCAAISNIQQPDQTYIILSKDFTLMVQTYGVSV